MDFNERINKNGFLSVYINLDSLLFTGTTYQIYYTSHIFCSRYHNFFTTVLDSPSKLPDY